MRHAAPLFLSTAEEIPLETPQKSPSKRRPGRPPGKPAGDPRFRTFGPTLLTALFLPADAPVPSDAPLPDAPVPNPHLRLPGGGVSLLYGGSASRLLGQALQRAQQQNWRSIGGRATTAFARVLATGQQLSLEQLPHVEVLWLNKLYTGSHVAERIQTHTQRYLEAKGHSVTLDPPLRFTEISHHPECLGRLLTEPEFAHLRAVVIVLPGVKFQDGLRPAAQMMYIRDLSALQSVQVDYGTPSRQQIFRAPTLEEVAQPRALLNPFAALLPKPQGVDVRVKPMNPLG